MICIYIYIYISFPNEPSKRLISGGPVGYHEAWSWRYRPSRGLKPSGHELELASLREVVAGPFQPIRPESTLVLLSCRICTIASCSRSEGQMMLSAALYMHTMYIQSNIRYQIYNIYHDTLLMLWFCWCAVPVACLCAPPPGDGCGNSCTSLLRQARPGIPYSCTTYTLGQYPVVFLSLPISPISENEADYIEQLEDILQYCPPFNQVIYS